MHARRCLLRSLQRLQYGHTDGFGLPGAIQKAALPSVLVSAKCDTPASKRQVDPNEIERKARRSITGISTLQTTEGNVEDHKRAISIILRSILFGSAGKCDPAAILYEFC